MRIVELREEGGWKTAIVSMFAPAIALVIASIAGVFFGFTPTTRAFMMTCVIFQAFLLALMVDPNPLNWWKLFLGVVVDADPAKMPKGTKDRDIQAWVKTSTKGPHVRINSNRYLFLKKKDAMIFKLTWG